MALVFDNIHAPDQPTPQLHAFIIGIGGYRHVADGVEAKDAVVNQLGVLQQLTSPPKSALAFRDLLLNSTDQWQAPLGSIEFLLSPAPSDPNPDGDGQNFAPATFDNISASFNAWKNRCESHEDNIALFYFCGHGVEKGSQYLLPDDFGKNEVNPWMHCISFDSTRLAFHQVKAKTQIFLVDACREITPQMLTRDLPENPLMIPEISPECQFNLTIKAAARSKVAMGPKNQPSYFTQALLKVFQQGALAKKTGNNTWVVNTGRIAAEINDILKSIQNTEDFKQRCNSEINESSDVFTLNATPLVDVSISAASNVIPFCEKLPNGPRTQRENHDAPWQFNTEAGIYSIGIDQNIGLHSFDPPSKDIKL